MSSRRWLAASGALALAAVGPRVWNAFAYPPELGFDALANWEYIDGLQRSWALPHPEAGFTTAHPPLFYYAAAGLRALLGGPERALAIPAIVLASALAGLCAIAAAVWLVLRTAPERPWRAWLAGALLAFLPAQLYTSAMLSEEVLAASLGSLAVVLLCLHLRDDDEARVGARGGGDARAALVGLLAGLAWLTKLSGVLVLAVAVAAYAVDGWRRGAPAAGLRRALLAGCLGALVGGWFYARNWLEHGYLYPHGLPAHRVMMRWPPGERGLWDYVNVPLATFRDPRAVQPELLRSVWGTTYATTWYDGHMHFLPRHERAPRRLGRLVLVLALLPTAAFAVGLARGARRALVERSALDTALAGLVAVTLAGYVLFTWRNPWFPTVKGSYLLGLQVPFAVYASEELERWLGTRARPWLAGALALLALGVLLLFTFGLLFAKGERPGFG